MGGALGVQIDFTGAKADDKDLEEKDNRKRNSIAFYISSFVEFEEDNFGPLIEVVMRDKNAKTGGKPPTIRNSSECCAVAVLLTSPSFPSPPFLSHPPSIHPPSSHVSLVSSSSVYDLCIYI
jgi:hypothetical protein